MSSSLNPASSTKTVAVEFTDDGNLRLSASVASSFFPGDALVAVPHGAELWLVPLTGPESGGLLLKQRNLAGDRSTLIWEALPIEQPVGIRQAIWDPEQGALRVSLAARCPSNDHFLISTVLEEAS